MKENFIISWNVRGLDKLEKRLAVKRLLRNSKTKLLFIQETKKQVVDSRLFGQLCGHNFNGGHLFSPSVGAAGGILSIWNLDFFVCESNRVTQHFVALMGKIIPADFNCMVINVYAPNSVTERLGVFNELKQLIEVINLPVILGGDFNEVLSLEERVGVNTHKKGIKDFGLFIDGLGLIDLPSHEGKFTWSNYRDVPACSRLDRFLISAAFLDRWPNLFQSLLPKNISDHNPIVISFLDINWGPRPFKWFDHLADDKALADKINEECLLSVGEGIRQMLRRCKTVTKEWVSLYYGKARDEISNIEARCAELENAILNGSSEQSLVRELNVNRGKLWECLRREEREWIQKSRIKWAISGDRNTKFFHLMASVRKNINVMSTLKIGKDSFCAPAQIKQAVRDHFKSSYNSSMTLLVKQFNCELPKLKESSSFRLERQFTEEEVWSVLSKMEASKAPGPDGFNMGSPVSLDDYRPISLVGCIYKLLAKVLAIRLGEVSEEIIGENQFAFCQGKQILDCSLIANELIDFSRRNRLEGVIFKADFRKAYDSVDWGFLMFVMEKMGFGPTWLKWIYCCLSTASISVLINGSPSNAFSIGRGLRQGCPLSPMLFILVAEALSVLIRSANKMSLFNGVRLGPSVPEITHLQFADDLIIFCGASETQIKNVVRLLKGFEIASGLKLNLLKSKLIGVNVVNNVIDSWANLLHCKRENLPCSYLGLPLGATKNSIHLWAPIVERFEQKLAGWKSRCLSFGGKLALVKSVLASVPIYFISIFAIPATIKSLLSKLIARFLWGSLDKKVIHWVSWETMCLPKSRGGLGLVDFGIKNRALLNKWLWKYGTEPNSLWRRIIAAKYEGLYGLNGLCCMCYGRVFKVFVALFFPRLGLGGFFNEARNFD
ncbi:hypothetical protein GQ457_03G038090 [Hibiscus cannabinus]